MFRIGDNIGPYSLLQKIGRGAFGEVWLAEEKTAISTHRVALKLPNEEDVDLEAIRQEANVWEEVKGHPNILPIIKADVVEDQIYIASEYAPDGSLSKWMKIQGGKAPTVETATRMIRGILSGLAHLHSKGIIHRDLKPENILLQAETPRIADFGIARLMKATSNSTKATGTPSYMAPECFYGTRSEQTDLWAVGVIFHLLLTGKQPFPQPDQVSVMNAILNGSPEIESSLPTNLRYVIDAALRKRPEERYGSAFEMLEDIEATNSTPLIAGRRFSGITIPTNPEADVEVETVVIPKHVEHQTIFDKLTGVNFWKIAVVALGMLILAFGGIWASFQLTSDKTNTPQNSQTANNNSSLDAVSQPVVPVVNPNPNAESSTTQLPTVKGDVPPESLPSGEGYNAWANGGAPPIGAPLPNYVPPRGQIYTIDPNNPQSQFMPPDSGVILVPVPANTNTAVRRTPKQTAPANAPESDVELILVPATTPKPMATPRRKTPTPEKTISNDCRYNGKCN